MTPIQERRWHRGTCEREPGLGLTVCWTCYMQPGLAVAKLIHVSGACYEYLIMAPPARRQKHGTGLIDGYSLEEAIDHMEDTMRAMGWDVPLGAPAHTNGDALEHGAGEVANTMAC